MIKPEKKGAIVIKPEKKGAIVIKPERKARLIKHGEEWDEAEYNS